MKLYVFPVAPNPTKLRLYVAEKIAGGAKLDLAEQVVDLRSGEQKTAAHRARSAFGKLPVLELDDGSFLTESLAIIEYLEELTPEPAMIGRTSIERARVRELERIAELGVMGPIARIVHATKSPLGLPPVPEIAAHARVALDETLRVLDAKLSDSRPFVAGDRPSIADCTLAAALQFARFGGVTFDAELSQLLRWDRSYRERGPAKKALSM
jgi:glutathione S-transferase